VQRYSGVGALVSFAGGLASVAGVTALSAHEYSDPMADVAVGPSVWQAMLSSSLVTESVERLTSRQATKVTRLALVEGLRRHPRHVRRPRHGIELRLQRECNRPVGARGASTAGTSTPG
jgi:hypothetical protein